jgi:hypothetical protein
MLPLRISARRWLPAVALLGLATALVVPSAAAEVSSTEPSIQLLAKAAPDECFAGIGLPYPPGPPCAQGRTKVNQAYVWGLAKAGQKLWFGTGANVLCLRPAESRPPSPRPTINEDWVCEFGRSQPAQQNPALPDPLGDHRTPEVFTYDLTGRQLTDRTQDVIGASATDAHLLRSTAGLRAGTHHRGVVLLGGPSLEAGVNLFAFASDSGQYLGSANLAAYENIRHFAVAGGVLYAGVGLGRNGGEGGRVLRWTGSRDNPFSFVEVGNLPTQAADLAVHNGRLYATTWPKAAEAQATRTAAAGPIVNDPKDLASVWMSPPLADGERGLNPADADGWTQVWHAGMYEPDPIVARTYALGGLESYAGHLYWGTMHVPLQATTAHLSIYPPKNEEQGRATHANTQRALVILRGRQLSGPNRQIEVLYGDAELPAYDPDANNGEGAWRRVSTGSTPRYGASGFGNPFNAYSWKMAVAGGKLYVGTMDWGYISAAESGPGLAATTGLAAPDPATFGADLWAFGSPLRPATAVDTTGLGNYLNQGVRNMVAAGSTLYLGIANPMNLRTDPNDDIPEGGWELLQLNTRP